QLLEPAIAAVALEAGQAGRQPRRDRKAARRQPLRRLDAAPERQGAPPPHHLAEAAHLAWDRDREAAALGERGDRVAVLEVRGGGDRCGRALACVERVDLLVLRDV